MEDSSNKRSRGFLSSALGVAKKLSEVGMDVINQVTPNEISKQDSALARVNVIEGYARQKGAFEANKYENPQQMLRAHVPQVSRQLLGKHYGKINKVANFVSPEFSDKISDYLFEQLNTFTNNISSVDAVLDEAGVRDLEELTQDVSRSQRISKALVEQNKWIASVQGALTGATGVVGSTIDVPVSIVMSLRTIYQVGRSYGFELNKESEQDIVQFIFKQINLGLIAEKQAVLMGIKALSNTLQTHDVQQLQSLIGSSNDIELLKKWLTNTDGEAKWQWMNNVPKFSMLTKMTPLVSASVSAVYSWKLVEEVNTKAQIVFAQARQYLIQHKDANLSPIHAYEKSLELIAQASPKLVEQIKATVETKQVKEEVTPVAQVSENEAVIKLKTEPKAKVTKTVSKPKAEEGQEKSIETLKEQNVAQPASKASVSAVKPTKAKTTTTRKPVKKKTVATKNTVTKNSES